MDSLAILPAQTYAPATVDRAAELLRSGRLVVLPTETVYGIAFSLASTEARSRVKTLKNLPERPAFVPHVASADDARCFVADLPPIAARTLRRAWPGPVAFQFRLGAAARAALVAHLGDEAAALDCLADSFLTLRCPDHPTTTDILAAAGVPVAILAASGPAGGVPYDLADVPDIVRASVDALVDGGPTRYRKPSTLVRVSSSQFSVSRLEEDRPSSSPTGNRKQETGNFLTLLRPGVIDERIVQRMADFVMLFVCTGNTCRSPMAAAIAQKVLADRLGVAIQDLPSRHVVVQSAGLHAMRGMRATREAVAAMKARSLDLGSHISQPATLDLLRRADVIFTMTDAHRDEIIEILPASAEKVHRLDPAGDVDDPIGGSETLYRQVADHLDQVIRTRVAELKELS